MKYSALSILILLSSLPCLADPDIAELIRRLDDDVPAVREAASEELRKRGGEAEGALKEAREKGSPEAQSRAGAILKEIAVDRVLAKLQAEELRKLWDDVENGTPAQRRFAIRQWVEACGRKPETVDALLELLTVDPAGSAGDAACEALNRLCAPRLTGVVEASGSGRSFLAGEPLEGMFKALLKERLRMTEAAKESLASVFVPQKNLVSSESELTQLRRYCQWAGVVWRMDDEAGTVSIEMPAESLAVWKPWWNVLKKDRLAMMDLGLLEAPAAAALKDDEMKEWVNALSASDPRHARIARRVLTESTDAQAAMLVNLCRKPDAPEALRAFAARLELRGKGRIAYTTGGRNEMKVRLMALDGSGARDVVPGALTWGLGVPGNQGTVGFVYIGPFDGVKTLHRVDLTGKMPPVPVTEPGEQVSLSPDCARFLAWNDNEVDSLRLVEIASGKSTPLPDLPAMRPEWSPDGRRIAVLNWKVSTLHLHDLASGKTVTCPDVSISNWDGWSPDSAHWAFNRVLERGPDGKRQIEVADATTGEARVVIGPIDAISLGRAVYSPDGRTLAAAWLERDNGNPVAAIALLDLATGKTRVERTPAELTGNVMANATVRWSSDGATVLWTYSDAFPGHAFSPATGKWTPSRPMKVGADWIPGTNWILQEREGDIVIFDLFEDFEINLTESGEDEHSAKFLQPLR